MKIAIIIPSLKTGGGQRIAIDIAGQNSEIFFIVIEKRVDNFFTSEVEKYHKVYYINKDLGFNPLVFLEIAKIFQKENPNIVHFHLGVSLYGLIPAFFYPHIKLIYTFHTIAQNDSEGAIRRLCNLGIKKRGMVPVAITETVKQSIEEVYKVKKIKLIYNGIYLDKYYSNDFIHSTINIISVGQIWKTKNHSFMIDIMKELVKRDEKYCLTILGDGPLKNEMERKIEKENLSEHVILRGNVNNVEDFLADSDIFLLTSQYEGLSLATLEAMASSLPIISTNVGGMSDIVQDNGFLLEENNVSLFVEKIELLSNNELLRKKMGLRSKELVKKYNIYDMQEQYMKLYREVLE